ncbi:hypothetical protein AB7813_08260 [Tardiphaga sp. 20_F10_N6_6]|uniref:hypothetical protein n=1 Tax=Tardiphaga sp. 20_F10_N6_6 TaxID=3240788 RepID=UPI003F8A3EAB
MTNDELKNSPWYLWLERRYGESVALRIVRETLEHARLPAASEAGAVPLTVWYGSMPESNGKSNWTAVLHRACDPVFEGPHVTIERSEYPDRVRHLIGELSCTPDILAYDAEKQTSHSEGDAGGNVVQPEIRAVLAMLDVPVVARINSHSGELLKPGQEPSRFESAVALVRESDHRCACEQIMAALAATTVPHSLTVAQGDEREAFEKAAVAAGKHPAMVAWKMADGSYADDGLKFGWIIWQRAALSRQPSSPASAEAADAARWRHIRRKLCLTGNGDGTCSMHAINLPAAISGWPEPGDIESFCDAAVDAARAALSAAKPEQTEAAPGWQSKAPR